ncbi:MAG: acyl--CoA ligase [Phycisphaerae bacterium]|nr:acyl--CoA ligase [Phycisphaerae bacterium]
MSGEAKLFRCIKSGKIVRFTPPWSNPLEAIEQWARSKPGKTAVAGLINGNRWIQRTYCQLLRRVLTITKALRDLPPDRLAVACGVHASLYEAIISALTAGREFIPIDFLRKPFDLQMYKFTDSQATAVIIPSMDEMPDDLVKPIHQLRMKKPHLKFWSLGDNPMAQVNLLAEVNDGLKLCELSYPHENWYEPSALIYSSGRHGLPKGYFYHSYALAANILSVSDWLKLNQRTRFLLTAEMDCCNGIIPMLATTASGGTVILHPDIDAENFWSVVQETDADLIRTQPQMIEALLQNLDKFTSINRSNLKYIITGSGYLPRQIGLRFFETFDVPILQCYGTADTGGYVLGMAPGLSWREYELALRDNLVGQELPMCNAKLSNESGANQRNSFDTNEGILYVRGHGVSCGFWTGSEIEHWNDAWLGTSDMAVNTTWPDQDNYQIRGRLEDTLLIGNQRFWPAYIERSILDTFSFISDCIAFALPDRTGQNVLHIVVVVPSTLPSYRRSELLSLMQARFHAGGVPGLTEKSTPQEIIIFDEDQIPRRYDGHADRAILHQTILQQMLEQESTAS